MFKFYLLISAAKNILLLLRVASHTTKIHIKLFGHKPLLLILYKKMTLVFPISFLLAQFPVAGIFVLSGK